MTRTKHIFFQDAPALRYAALGDTSVRVLTLDHIIRTYELDAVVIPQPNREFVSLWKMVLGEDKVCVDATRIPVRFRTARVSRPTSLDWAYGSAGHNVFESVMWESGFFDTQKLKIAPPVVFKSNQRVRAAMIYPAEATDGNRVLNNEWWIQVCEALRKNGWQINLLGHLDHPLLGRFLRSTTFDKVYPPTLDGMRECISMSSIAIGGSTGPTWTLLMSDIPQIVIETKQSPHGYWFFDRCQCCLQKRLSVVTTIDCAIKAANGGF